MEPGSESSYSKRELIYENCPTIRGQAQILGSKAKTQTVIRATLEPEGEKAMAPHSSTLAWKIPRTEEPGGLQSMGSLRVGHDSVTSLSLFTFMHWRRKRQPTAVFLPAKCQGQRSLMGCRLWGQTRLKQLSSSRSRARGMMEWEQKNTHT